MDQLQINNLVGRIVDRHLDRMFTDLDNLHAKGVNDSQVKAALISNSYSTMADWYEEWMNDGEPLPEADGAPRGVVIDDANATSYAGLNEQLLRARGSIDRDGYFARLAKDESGWFIYRKRNTDGPGGLIGKVPTGEHAIQLINTLQEALNNADN